MTIMAILTLSIAFRNSLWTSWQTRCNFQARRFFSFFTLAVYISLMAYDQQFITWWVWPKFWSFLHLTVLEFFIVGTSSSKVSIRLFFCLGLHSIQPNITYDECQFHLQCYIIELKIFLDLPVLLVISCKYHYWFLRGMRTLKLFIFFFDLGTC